MYFGFSAVRRAGLFITGAASLTYITIRNLSESNVEKSRLKMGGEDFAVPEEVQNLINEVIKDMKLKQAGIQIAPYITNSTDPKAYCPLLSTSILLGIPQHFIYDADNDKNFTALVDGQEIPKDAPQFQSLKHSMCLSNEAKKFGIAYALYEAQYSDIFPYAILPMVVAVYYNVLHYFLEKSHLPARSFPKRNHILLYLFSPITYLPLHDIARLYKEYASNSQTADLGKTYIKAGIEYYKKMIQRNKVLRSLNKGDYTEDGDITNFWRNTHVSLYKRITYIEETSKEKTQNFWYYLFFNN